MPVLQLASCMAENGEPFCQNVAAYIHTRLGIETGYVNDTPWQERERLFDEGKIQILWLCGLPYIHKADPRENDMGPMDRCILSGGQMARFVSASDTDFDPIRIMARAAEQVRLELCDLINRFLCGRTMLIF
jgi:hypothetical protein